MVLEILYANCPFKPTFALRKVRELKSNLYEKSNQFRCKTLSYTITNTSFSYHQFSCHINISSVISLNIYPKYINEKK